MKVDPFKDDLCYSSSIGTLLKPNKYSYMFLSEAGILMITSKIKNSDFMICYNFVLKYLSKILNNKEIYYYGSSFSSEKENKSHRLESDIDPFIYLKNINKDKLKFTKTISRNSIVFYGDNSCEKSFEPSHVGFIISLFDEMWVISKFGGGPLFLHKLNTVPEDYLKPVGYLEVTDSNYSNYIRKIESLIEKQITKMKEIK